MEEIGLGMPTREALRQRVDELPEDQTELAHACLQDLHGAADEEQAGGVGARGLGYAG